jgi:hypothetical protein
MRKGFWKTTCLLINYLQKWLNGIKVVTKSDRKECNLCKGIINKRDLLISFERIGTLVKNNGKKPFAACI